MSDSVKIPFRACFLRPLLVPTVIAWVHWETDYKTDSQAGGWLRRALGLSICKEWGRQDAQGEKLNCNVAATSISAAPAGNRTWRALQSCFVLKPEAQAFIPTPWEGACLWTCNCSVMEIPWEEVSWERQPYSQGWGKGAWILRYIPTTPTFSLQVFLNLFPPCFTTVFSQPTQAPASYTFRTGLLSALWNRAQRIPQSWKNNRLAVPQPNPHHLRAAWEMTPCGSMTFSAENAGQEATGKRQRSFLLTLAAHCQAHALSHLTIMAIKSWELLSALGRKTWGPEITKDKSISLSVVTAFSQSILLHPPPLGPKWWNSSLPRESHPVPWL